MQAQPESEQVEYKRSLVEAKAGIEAIAAFATARGGVVRFGVDPNGARVGVQIGINTLENLANDIKRNTEPPQFPSITVDGDEDSAVVNVDVEESPIKPVYGFGRAFKRVGRTNQVLSREETRRLIEETTGRSWDALPCHEFRAEDLSREAVEDFLRRAGQDQATPTETVLDNLKLRTAEGYTNGAPLLFGKDPQRFFVSALLQCGRFLGTSSVDFLDERTIRATLFRQLDEAMAFVARNTRQALVITGKPQHDLVPEYPSAAVREAIINAIIHRRYYTTPAVQVRIYDDRLEVWNPGVLPHTLTIDSLYGPHRSHPRNPLLADAFHRAGLIERWGTGTLRILRECEARGLPRPEFLEEDETFIVRFRPGIVPAPPSELMKQFGRAGQMSQREQQVLEYVLQHGSITRREIMDLFGIRPSAAADVLSGLVRQGMLERVNAGRLTRYRIPENTNG